MIKKIEKQSMKKIPASLVKRIQQDKLNFDRIVLSQEKIGMQRKQKSSEKYHYLTNKVTFEGQSNRYKKDASNQIRIKTEMDEPILSISHRMNSNDKSLYAKLSGFKKKKFTPHVQESQETLKKLESGSKFKEIQSSTNDKIRMKLNNMNKPFFLCENLLKNNCNKISFQRCEGPLTVKKHYSTMNKRNNDRFEYYLKKKMEIDKYTSQGFQKLNLSSIRTKKNQDQSKKKSEQKSSDKRKKIYSHLLADKIKEKRQQQKLEKQEEQAESIKNNILQGKALKMKTEMEEIEKENKKLLIVFQKPKIEENPFDLSNQEMEIFGNRFPESFDKLKLLGRGGFSLVWLGEHRKTKKKFAIKQIKTENSHQTHKKEIWFGTHFFELGGVPKKQFLNHIGIKNLVKLYSYDINRNDTWIFYEKCGQSLGNALYQLKRENHDTQKIYRILYKPFYLSLQNNQNLIGKIINEVAKALVLLSQNKLVHSDLKTQNILIKVKNENQDIQEVKLIDYGSSFIFGKLDQFSMATPEYLAPEILNFILYENQVQYIPKLMQYLEVYEKPWVIDVWSLGCVLLQIVSGIPLWMSLKTIVKRGNKQQELRTGLFAVKGRLFDQIIKQQIEVIQNLDYYLSTQNFSGIQLHPQLKTLLRRMLTIDPAQRISPQQIINVLNKKVF